MGVWRSYPQAIRKHGKPRCIVTDQGVQFTSRRFTRLLVSRRVGRRFGAVARPQSVARIDRFWKSMKTELGMRLSPWLPLEAIQRKLSFYETWFNSERPHEGLALRTPDEVWSGRRVKPKRRVQRGVLEVRLVGDDPGLPTLRLRAAG